MDRERVLAKAKEFVLQEGLLGLVGERRRSQSDMLADFHIAMSAERDAEIADELDKCCKQTPIGYQVVGKWMPPRLLPSPCDLLFCSVRNLIDRLQGKQ